MQHSSKGNSNVSVSVVDWTFTGNVLVHLLDALSRLFIAGSPILILH